MPAGESGVVTVVGGVPRSGTSLMMQMLAAGGVPVLTDGVRAADPDNPRGYFEYEPVKRTRHDPSWVAAAAGKAVKVVHAHLPDLPPGPAYRVILMRRGMADVLASQRAMLARRGAAGADLPDDRLARQFRLQFARAVEAVTLLPHTALLQLDFEAVVADPAAAAGRVAEFLGGRPDAAAMARAVDPTLHRNRTGTTGC